MRPLAPQFVARLALRAVVGAGVLLGAGLVTACSTPATSGGDGAQGSELGVVDLAPADATMLVLPPDMTVPFCTQVANQVKQYYVDHRVCKVDSDCTFARSDCGLAGVCGDYINKDGVNGLASIVGTWNQYKCAGVVDMCMDSCSSGTPTPTCNGGACGKRLPMRIGDGCVDETDCNMMGMGGMLICITDPPFTGGYCSDVVANCTTNAGDCGPGSLCRQVSLQGVVKEVCLKSCAVQGDCRAGYLCCPTWKPGPPGKVCAPGPCP